MRPYLLMIFVLHREIGLSLCMETMPVSIAFESMLNGALYFGGMTQVPTMWKLSITAEESEQGTP